MRSLISGVGHVGSVGRLWRYGGYRMFSAKSVNANAMSSETPEQAPAPATFDQVSARRTFVSGKLFDGSSNVSSPTLTKEAKEELLRVNSVWGRTDYILTSTKKLGLLARQINRKKLDWAIVQMNFSPKGPSLHVAHTLEVLRKKALELGYDQKRLYIHQAVTNKYRTGRGIDIKGRGRMGRLSHPSSFMTVEIKQDLSPSWFRPWMRKNHRWKRLFTEEERRIFELDGPKAGFKKLSRGANLWTAMKNPPIRINNAQYPW